MKKKVNIAVTIFVFLALGELLIRFNKTYDLLNDSPKVIAVEIEDTKLKSSIDNNTFEFNDNQLRIMVIGDSYINGGGIATNQKFSKKLAVFLNEYEMPNVSIKVLDVSRPSNNTLDNYQSFLYYQERFHPQFVFWAYNFNDVLGGFDLDQKIIVEKDSSLNLPPKRAKKESRNKSKAFVKKLYSKSELLRFLSSNLQKELKLQGIVLPFGDFHFLTTEGYNTTNPNWNTTIKLLDDVVNICEADSSQLIVYKMPEFNLLERPELFSEINRSLESYNQSAKSMIYFNGQDDFSKDDGSDFMISRYDGHPNSLAHNVIAKRIAAHIKSQLYNK